MRRSADMLELMKKCGFGWFTFGHSTASMAKVLVRRMESSDGTEIA